MIKFKDFITANMTELWESDPLKEIAEPIEVCFDEHRFLFAVDWHISNKDDLKKFVSKKVYDSYVEKIWLDQNTGRIGIALTNELDKNDD